MFEDQLNSYLEPITEQLRAPLKACEVHWVYPNEPENNHSFEIPKEEANHYLRSMISEGFLNCGRFLAISGTSTAQLFFWQEWDGSSGFIDRMPSAQNGVIFEAVWKGFEAKSEG